MVGRPTGPENQHTVRYCQIVPDLFRQVGDVGHLRSPPGLNPDVPKGLERWTRSISARCASAAVKVWLLTVDQAPLGE